MTLSRGLDPRLLEGCRWLWRGLDPTKRKPAPGLKPGANRNKACFKQAKASPRQGRTLPDALPFYGRAGLWELYKAICCQY
jgi:hypothetical protein